MKNLITKLLAVGIMFGATSYSTANEYRHINTLAAKIFNKSKRLANEARHYRHTPTYELILADTDQMRRLARHIREVARREGDIRYLASDLRDLHRVFRHVERLFDRTECNAAYGAGHVRGNTRHVKVLLNDIEECIQHMRADVRAIRLRAQSFNACNANVRPRPVHPNTFGYRNDFSHSRYASRNGPNGFRFYDDGYGSLGGITIGRGGYHFNLGF